MKNLFLTLFLGAIFLFIGTAVFTHGRYGGNWHGMRAYNGHGLNCINNTEYLSDELKLSEKQQKEIEKINITFREKFYNAMGDHDKMWNLRDENLKAIEKILTKEQKDKLNKISKNRGYMGYYKNYNYYGHGRGCW